MTKSVRNKVLFAFLSLFLLTVLYFWGDIKQNDSPAYFDFADKASFLGIPNAMDVLSNLPFLAVGVWGLLGLKKIKLKRLVSYRVALSISIAWTAFGSAYFHWNPNPSTLFWDRLPMCFVFGSIIGMIAADKINPIVGKWCAIGLSLIGANSLMLWTLGLGDLRPYIVLQGGGLLFVLFLATFFWNGELSNKKMIFAFLIYILAKIFESKDQAIYEATGFVSGHTLKHLAAAISVWMLLTLSSVKKT